jgi:hypothetical protein
MDEQTKIKTEKFAEIVRRYCNWAESLNEAETDLQTAQKILAELFLNVLDLPDDEFEDDIELEDVTAEQWKLVGMRFSNLPINGYWTIFDPIYDEEKSAVYGLISDDLADIYRDIKYGLLFFDAGHFSEAVWEWKFNFKVHWGRHLLEAQKVIYSYFN